MMKMFVQYHQEALKSLRSNVPLPKLDAIISEMFAEFAALSGVKQELKIAE